MKTFKIGSRAFFENLPDYKEHDCDVLMVLDKWPSEIADTRFSCRATKCDAFFMKQMTKEEYIAETLETEDTKRVFYYMVPEFAQFVGLTIDDLKLVEPVVRKLENTRHKWYINVYEAYVANNGFFLTDEQREVAYKVFKSTRPRRFNRPVQDESAE